MSRQLHKGSFLLVEGLEDLRFWRNRISDSDCEIIRADGKPNVLGAIQKLDSRLFSGALGVVDDDCDSLEGWLSPSSNIVVTDAWDLECMLLRSCALERVLAEFGDPEKIKRFQEQSGVSVRQRLLENGLAFGKLRWLSKRQDWGLDFGKQLKPERFLDREAWFVDAAGLTADGARLAGISNNELHTLLEALPTVDPWYVCQGHDLVEILKLGLQKALGNLKPSYGRDNIASSLRLAFHAVEFSVTRLYRNICDWEQMNGHYRILPIMV
ncbi:MAG: DUF4435 domain-containing protein [Methylococcales bacterium]